MVKEVSTDWIDNQNQLMTSAGYVEIACEIIDPVAQNNASVSSLETAYFSDTESVTTSNRIEAVPVGTLEWNFWTLDGTYEIPINSTDMVVNSGYAGSDSVVSMTFHEVMANPIPGIVIIWGKPYGEYAVSFDVVFMNGSDVLQFVSVRDNTSLESLIEIPMQNYDRIEIRILSWSIPNRRYRIEKITLGWYVTFTKNDIMSYKHSSTADPISGVLPKNSVDFTLNNFDNKWDISNAKSFAKYLIERQRVTTRYGFDINGSVEWIKGGVFYLHEWKVASNNLSVQFVARDAFEFMIDQPYQTDGTEKTLYEHCVSAIEQSEIPVDYVIDERLKNYSTAVLDDYSTAEILQYCANAVGDGIYQDRDGILHICDITISDDIVYPIYKMMQYEHPETELSKPLGSIVVTYANGASYTSGNGVTGLKQTLRNEFISNQDQAEIVAEKTKNYLGIRDTMTSNYRADPRLDVFDTVLLYTKNNTYKLLVTEITYTFNGGFRGRVKGKCNIYINHYAILDVSAYIENSLIG